MIWKHLLYWKISFRIKFVCLITIDRWNGCLIKSKSNEWKLNNGFNSSYVYLIHLLKMNHMNLNIVDKYQIERKKKIYCGLFNSFSFGKILKWNNYFWSYVVPLVKMNFLLNFRLKPLLIFQDPDGNDFLIFESIDHSFKIHN